jgi:hypothetical protein
MPLRSAAALIRPVAAFLVAAALVLFGVAPAAVLPPQLGTDLRAFVLPDGSLPELCAAEHQDAPDPGHARHQGCLAACMAGLTPALLPARPALAARVAVAWRHRPLPTTGSRPRPRRTAAQARAPPSLG